MDNKRTVFLCLILMLIATHSYGEDFWKLDFSLKSEFNYRTISGGLSDDDTQKRLFENLSFWGYRKADGREINLLVSGKYVKNFEKIESDSLLYDITDTYSSSERFEPQQVYMAIDGLFGSDVFGIKIGRQFYYGAEPVRFDGGFAYLQDPGGKYVRIHGYAGSIVSYYDEDIPDEVPWGVGAKLIFIPGNITYFDIFRFLDQTTIIGFNQKLFAFAQLSGEFRAINGHPSEAKANFQWWSYRHDFLADLFYRGALGPRRRGDDVFLFDYYSTDNNKPNHYSTDETYYYQDYRLDNLNFTPIMPYWEVGLTLEKGFIKGLLRPGAEYAVHRLSNSNDEDYFNYSYDRARAWVSLSGLPLDDFTLALGFELNRDVRDRASEKLDSEALYGSIVAGFLDHKIVGEARIASRTYHYKEKDRAGDEYWLGLKYNPCAYSSLGIRYESIGNSWYQEVAGTNRVKTIVGTLEVRY